MKLAIALWVVFSIFFGSQFVGANEVRIVDVTAKREIGFFGDSYLFVVTLEHKDEDWNHFADRWEVWTPDGKTLVDATGEAVHCAMNWRDKNAFLDLVTERLIGGSL